MQTATTVPFSHTNNIPNLRVHARELPEQPGITCIDFETAGNTDLQATLKNAMLVPDGMLAPRPGAYTLYTIPRNCRSIELTVSLGVVNDKDFVVAQIAVFDDDDERTSLTHVPCELS